MDWNNDLIKQIIIDLPLIEKLKFRSINKQFKTCVEQILANEKSIQFVNTYGKGLDVFVNKFNKNKIEFNFNDSNQCLIQLLSKFPELRRLEFDNNIRINDSMIEWLFKRCPKLDSLSLLDYRCNYWTIDWIELFFNF